MPDFDKTELHNVVVGGLPVGFTKSTGKLHLAGDELTLEQWQEIERRVNLFFYRAGSLKDPRKKSRDDPNSGTSSFLSANLREILRRDEGIIKNPPRGLKWLYSGVITKDRLRGM